MTPIYTGALIFTHRVPMELPIPVTSKKALMIEIQSNTNDETSPVADLFQYGSFEGVGALKIERFDLVSGANLILLQVPVPSTFRIAPKFNGQTLTLSVWEFNMPISRGTSTIEPITSSDVAKTTVAASATSVLLLDQNSDRKAASILNNSTATLFVELGATASNSAYTVALGQGDLYELPIAYTGKIAGVWSAANGNALVREFV